MDNKKLMTELRFEGGKATSFFESHLPIDVAGLSKTAEIPEAWSPPHMFIASIESCFLLTMLSVAEKMHIGIKSYSSTAEGIVSSSDGKHFEVTEITIRPTLNLENESDRLRLRVLFEKAEEYCLVRQSAKTNVKIEI